MLWKDSDELLRSGSLSVGPGEEGKGEVKEELEGQRDLSGPGPAPTSIFTWSPRLYSQAKPPRRKQCPGIKAKNPNSLHKSLPGFPSTHHDARLTLKSEVV